MHILLITNSKCNPFSQGRCLFVLVIVYHDNGCGSGRRSCCCCRVCCCLEVGSIVAALPRYSFLIVAHGSKSGLHSRAGAIRLDPFDTQHRTTIHFSF